MEYRAQRWNLLECDAIVVPLFAAGEEGAELPRGLPKPLATLTAELVGHMKARGRGGEVQFLCSSTLPEARWILGVGAGKRPEFSLRTVREAAGAAVRHLRHRKMPRVAFALTGAFPAPVEARGIVEGALDGLYEGGKYRTRRVQPTVDVLMVIAPERARPQELSRAMEDGAQETTWVTLARTMVDEPPSRLPPTEMARIAAEMAKAAGLGIEVHKGAALRKLKMGALLGVASGSEEPACLIALRHKARSKTAPTLALVGKGITFDSGGLNLKTPSQMESMKMDMAGGAAVIAAMRAIGDLGLDLNVLGIVAATENLPSARPYKPGDVLEASSGKTIEVTDTDAEGRIVLADALAYAVKQGATHIVDVATLTGACMTALGRNTMGVFGRPQAWVDTVLRAAKDAGEPAWQLPLLPEIREDLRSPVADIRNTGEDRYGGAIRGALFLQEFVDELPWVHLDIAGPAWREKKTNFGVEGGTGFAVRTLVTLARMVARRRARAAFGRRTPRAG